MKFYMKSMCICIGGNSLETFTLLEGLQMANLVIHAIIVVFICKHFWLGVKLIII